jgi:hypothetical protein
MSDFLFFCVFKLLLKEFYNKKSSIFRTSEISVIGRTCKFSESVGGAQGRSREVGDGVDRERERERDTMAPPRQQQGTYIYS